MEETLLETLDHLEIRKPVSHGPLHLFPLLGPRAQDGGRGRQAHGHLGVGGGDPHPPILLNLEEHGPEDWDRRAASSRPGNDREHLLGGDHRREQDKGVVGRWPNANVGVPTGRASGLLVLDVDAGDGLESLAELELSCGQLPKTARARTGRGGEHVYLLYPKDVEVRNSQGYLGPGLDIRAEGGYLIVPPSRTIRPYEWVDRSRPAEASWLLGCLEERTRRARPCSRPP